MRLLPSTLLATLLAFAAASQYDPHESEPGENSWFEGWYVRLMPQPPPESGSPLPASLSLIVAVQPNAPAGWGRTMMSMTVLNSSLLEPAPSTYTRHGMALGITGAGGATAATPDFTSPPDLTISAADGSLTVRLQGDSCQLAARFGRHAAQAADAAAAPQGSPGATVSGSPGQDDAESSDDESVTLVAECTGPPMLWDATGAGPEGCAAALPTSVTGLHWFVHSLATPMRFTLLQGRRPPVHGVALAHWEKNWGRTFPSGWHWAQGVNSSVPSTHSAGKPSNASEPSGMEDSSDADGSGAGAGRPPPAVRAAFALAGGRLPSPLVPESWLPDLWLLGVRTAKHSWDLHGYDSVFTSQADPCQATLLVTATQPLQRRAVDVQITARPASFASLEGPTRQGFQPYMDESLSGFATVRLFELRFGPHEHGWVQKVLLESFEIEGAALEFGGDRRCSKERSEEGVAAESEAEAELAVA